MSERSSLRGSAASALPRVAVIAIHGVGHHESGATAEAVTDLLTGVEIVGRAHPENRYTSFALRQVQLPLEPPPDIRQIKAEEKANQGGLSATFEERRGE